MARKPDTPDRTDGPPDEQARPPASPSPEAGPARPTDANGDPWTTRPERHPNPGAHPAAISPSQAQAGWALRIVYEPTSGSRRVLCGTVRRVDPPEEVELISGQDIDTSTVNGPRLVLDATNGERGVVLVIPPHDHGTFTDREDCPQLGPEHYILRRRAGASSTLRNDGAILGLFRVVGGDGAGEETWRSYLTPDGEVFRTRKRNTSRSSRYPPGERDGEWARRADLSGQSNTD